MMRTACCILSPASRQNKRISEKEGNCHATAANASDAFSGGALLCEPCRLYPGQYPLGAGILQLGDTLTTTLLPGGWDAADFTVLLLDKYGPMDGASR